MAADLLMAGYGIDLYVGGGVFAAVCRRFCGVFGAFLRRFGSVLEAVTSGN